MALVTLIGEKQAREGYEFIFRGPVPECKDCRLKTVCFSLTEGRRYRVKAIRPIKHQCKIHETGVMIVEVEEIPIEIGIPQKTAIEGAIIAIERPQCKNVGCANYSLCCPVGVKEGTKYKVIEIKGTLDCPNNENIKRVRIN